MLIHSPTPSLLARKRSVVDNLRADDSAEDVEIHLGESNAWVANSWEHDAWESSEANLDLPGDAGCCQWR